MNWIHRAGAPATLYRWCEYWATPFAVISLVLLITGLVWGGWFAPADYQQGDAFRIIYVHVPAAIGSMALLTTMAILSFIYLVWHIKAAAWIAVAAAPIGLLYTAIALVTGAIWGKPMWGTWWIWDARLTSELILLFLYIGYLGLYHAFPNRQKAYHAAAIFALIAWIDIPIIHYSVQWWQTLHQGSTLMRLKPSIAPAMLWPLLVMLLAFAMYAAYYAMRRVQVEILYTHAQSRWVTAILRDPQ